MSQFIEEELKAYAYNDHLCGPTVRQMALELLQLRKENEELKAELLDVSAQLQDRMRD